CCAHPGGSMVWLRRLRTTLFGGADEPGIDEELRFHLDERTQEYVQAGMTLDDARREARRRLGGLILAGDGTRDVQTLRALSDFGQDVRHAIRTLQRTRGFTLAALVTLTLGIGATSAKFSVVYGVLLRPLPFPAGERLVRVWEEHPGGAT